MTTTYHSAEDIADELATRLAQITVLNGWETDIGVSVFKGLRRVQDEMVPCVSVIEGTDTITDRPGRLPTVQIDQRYVLGAYMVCDPANPNVAAHAAIRDMKKAIFVEEEKPLGGKAKDVKYKGRDIGPRADGVAIVFAMIEIEVTYVEDLTNP